MCLFRMILARQAAAAGADQYPQVNQYLLVHLCLYLSGHHGGQPIQDSVQTG